MKRIYTLCILLSSSVILINAQSINNLPLFDIEQLTYKGAFRIDSGEQGVSNINYSEGPIAYNYENHSLFIVGHSHQQAIAEYAIPDIIDTEVFSELIKVDAPLQVFSQVLNRTPDGNLKGIDRIGGMYYVNHGGQKKLIVNGYEYYDALGNNTVTSLIINNANNLETSSVSGYFTFNGGAGHASGWLSPIPETLQESFGGSHITGHSSGIPIISRTSVGPSAFAFNIQDALNSSDDIATETLLDFSLTNPL